MSWLLTKLILGYQMIVSPILPRSCRYLPACSSYMLEAIQYYGVLKGLYLGIKRIMRCHPWHEGGFDPVSKPETDLNAETKKTNI